MTDEPRPPGIGCPTCGVESAATLLACPRCHAFYHAEELKEIAAEADDAERCGDLQGAQAAWRRSLLLLPPESRQYRAIVHRLGNLSKRADSAPEPPMSLPPSPSPGSRAGPNSGGGKTGAGAGAVGLGGLALLLWKSKVAILLILRKGKLLLFGLKGPTLLTMFGSLGAYWTEFGWWFALGLILSIYVHEMGHVAALRRYGIAAGAPMFIPGLGALIRLRQDIPDARVDAQVGLAGPFWGLWGVLACEAISLATGCLTLAAVARVGAWINLFNLVPIWQLDGSRGFRAISRPRRVLAILMIALMWALTKEGLLLVIGVVAIARALTSPPPDDVDRGVAFRYIFLVIVLAMLSRLPVHPGA